MSEATVLKVSCLDPAVLQQVIDLCPLVLTPETSLAVAIASMAAVQSAYALVVEGDRLVGIMTECDVRQAQVTQCAECFTQQSVQQWMTHPVTTLSVVELEVGAKLLDRLSQNVPHYLPIVDENEQLQGVLKTDSLSSVWQSVQVTLTAHAHQIDSLQQQLRQEEERRQILEQALADSQAQYQVLVQQQPQLIHAALQIQHLNSSLERQVKARTAQLELAYNFEATLKRITDRVRDSLDETQILQTAVEELAIAVGVKGCNAALYDLEQGTSTISYEYTTSVSPSQGRVTQLKNFPELYTQLLSGHSFQFCSLIPNPVRGRVALLTAPILDDQRVLGDLWLINHSYYGFKAEDIWLVEQVASQCAIALRQARLYKAAQAQVQELEHLNQLKDDFLSTVSHELRTPMTNIKMAVQMLDIVLAHAQSPCSSPQTQRYLNILRSECQREISLINDLLDWSRLEAQSLPVSLSAIQLQPCLNKIVAAIADRFQNQQQTLQIQVSPELPPLLTDAISLDRILAELLHNACKYTPAGETIQICAQALADGLELRVSNSGVNLSDAELNRIFDKFYRIPNNDPWKHGGTGLGLALVKKLMENLGGDIQVEHQEHWLTFVLHFPQHPALPCS